ncbi:MAG: type IX secretion system protein PorQ [Bacteroidetes bacterium]|nr:type IX secretion system protein PorQ [Bacteroidota bacterium]
MYKINILTLLFVNLLLVNLVNAQSGGTKVFSFLELPVSPRSATNGLHAVSLANPDLFSLIGNPAYANKSFHNQVQFSYMSHFADANYSALAYSYAYDSTLQLSSSLRYLTYGDFSKYDEFGNETGSFSSYDMGLSFSASKVILTNLNIAASFTLIRSAIENYTSNGLSITAGAYYLIPSQLITIGLALRDLGFQFNNFNLYKENIPFDISLGITKRLKYVPFRFTITSHSLQDWPLKTIYDSKKTSFWTDLSRHFAFGGEFLFSENFTIRFGMNKYRSDAIKTENRIDLSGTAFGAGFKISRFNIDISRTSFSSIGAQYQLSILTHF